MDFTNRSKLLDLMDVAMSEINPTDIKGKPYAEVKERVKAFRKVWPDGSIMTELISDDGNRCVFKATVFGIAENGDPIVLASAHAYEVRTAGKVNATSYLENCETSACGRALGFAGYGIDAAIASADETDRALAEQDAIKKAELEEQTLTPLEAAAFEAHLMAEGIDIDKMLKSLKIGSLEEMKLKTYRNIFDNMAKAKEAWT